MTLPCTSTGVGWSVEEQRVRLRVPSDEDVAQYQPVTLDMLDTRMGTQNFDVARGTLDFTGNPANLDTFILSDGTNPSTLFTFHTVAPAAETTFSREITIGAGANANAATARIAIDAAPSLDMDAAGSDPQVTLTNTPVGAVRLTDPTLGNVPVVDNVANMTATGMAGGEPLVRQGSKTHPWSSVADIVASPPRGMYPTFIAAEDVAAGSMGDFWLSHPEILVACTSDVDAAGLALTPDHAGGTDFVRPLKVAGDSNVFARIVGFSHEAIGATRAGHCLCAFDGIHFGGVGG